ncbi:hypothetical protein CVT25_012988 [Psilocybe cyanescens]|uniref:DUF6534 domain-containing protein n=1 Tax=Psilocybe cyanescens TaxID=93625 RepID=A0A409XHN4_PSICY|nr:hypothetical protein CVT25_012988 [Psilocybe cyanescens]
MQSSLDSTYGIWLICLCIQILSGCIFIGIKMITGGLNLWEITYFYLINGFGDVHVDRNNKILSGIIVCYTYHWVDRILIESQVALALAQIGLGLDVDLALGYCHPALRHYDNCIACALSGQAPEGTGSILTTLMINAVNRGVLTAFCALPETFYFFIGLELSGKSFEKLNQLTSPVYMNSALATLNTRQHTRARAHSSDSVDWNFVSTGGVSHNIGVTFAAPEDGHSDRIQIYRQACNDGEFPDYMTSAFTDGML